MGYLEQVASIFKKQLHGASSNLIVVNNENTARDRIGRLRTARFRVRIARRGGSLWPATEPWSLKPFRVP